MSVEFSCSCGRRLRVAEDLAGKEVRCPACFKVVPAIAAAPQPPMAELAPEAPIAASRPRSLEGHRPPAPIPLAFVRTSRWATASMAASTVSLFAGVFLLVFIYAWVPGGIAGVVLGLVALMRISSSKGEVRGKAKAWFGITLGAVLLSFSLVVLWIADDVRRIGAGVAGFCEELRRVTEPGWRMH